MSDKKEFSCEYCGTLNCHTQKSRYPKFCVTTNMDEELLNSSVDMYKYNEDDKNIALAAAAVEGEFYGTITRVEEIIYFAKKIGAKSIGVASCVGLSSEAKIFSEILHINEFEVHMAVCKVGSIDKSNIGIKEETKIHPNEFEPMCNPILQANYLNEKKSDLNVIIGLCVGHDTLFIKYSKAPITYLVVKDRLLGHNPIAALHNVKTYYKRLLIKK